MPARLSASDRRRRRAAVERRDGARCRRCGSKQNLTLDHIQPLAHGGTHHITNLQLLCAACNNAKGCSLPHGTWVFA